MNRNKFFFKAIGEDREDDQGAVKPFRPIANNDDVMIKVRIKI